MIRACVFGLLGVLACLTATLADENDSKIPPYRSPGQFRAEGQAEKFIPYARQYLNQDLEHDLGAQVAQDLLMLATAFGDQAAAQEAKHILLFRYPESLPANYLIRTSKPEELRDLLKTTFRSSSKPLQTEDLKQFYTAFRFCYGFAGSAVTDDELWAQAALAWPGPEVAEMARQHFTDPEGEAARLLEIAFDRGASGRERFLRLHDLREFETARVWQTYLYHHELRPSEKEDSGVRAILAENLLADSEFDAALAILRELTPTIEDPKLHFWQGWAEAATGDVSAAVRTLKQVVTKHPQSPWAAPAMELTDALSSLEENLKENLSGLSAVIEELQTHSPEVLELTFVLNEGPTSQIEAYLGFNFVENAMEALVHQAGKPVLGYSTHEIGASYFVRGDEQIHRFAEKGAVPVLQIPLRQKPDGRYDFLFGIQFSSNPDGTQAALEGLAGSPVLSTPMEREKFVSYQLKKGAFPAKVESAGGVRKFRWLMPSVDGPKIEWIEFNVSEDSHLASVILSKEGSFRDIRYGAGDQLSLSRPKWPDFPIRDETEMHPSVLFQLLGAAMELFYPQQNSTGDAAGSHAAPQKAKKPVTTRIR